MPLQSLPFVLSGRTASSTPRSSETRAGRRRASSLLTPRVEPGSRSSRAAGTAARRWRRPSAGPPMGSSVQRSPGRAVAARRRRARTTNTLARRRAAPRTRTAANAGEASSEHVGQEVVEPAAVPADHDDVVRHAPVDAPHAARARGRSRPSLRDGARSPRLRLPARVESPRARRSRSRRRRGRRASPSATCVVEPGVGGDHQVGGRQTAAARAGDGGRPLRRRAPVLPMQSLRRHYPDQVRGVGDASTVTLSARLSRAPRGFTCAAIVAYVRGCVF